MDDRAGLFTPGWIAKLIVYGLNDRTARGWGGDGEGMGADDLLCSRNARPPKALVGRAQWKISQPPSLKRERASVEGAFISFDARS